MPSAGEARSEENPSLPHPWFLLQRAGNGGTLPVNIRSRALEAARQAGGLRNTAGTWAFAGPMNIGGRVSALAQDPNDPDHLWLGGAEGGVFTTFDAGATWTAVFDSQTSLSIGALAAHPTDSNTVYVGTGEENGGGYTYEGEGVFRTTDGGATWTNLGLGEVRHIGKMAIDPLNPQRIFVAGGGGIYNRDVHRGVYRSTDGGATWQKVLYVADDAGACDITIDPSNPNRVFAAIWERGRMDNETFFGGPASAIYRSTDGGTTWAQLGGGLPPGPLGRIGLAIAPSSPNIVYAWVSEPNGALNGIWKSLDGGDTWTRASAARTFGLFSPHGYYFGQIRVHPLNPNQVFVLEIPMWRSDDGGVNFLPFGEIHVDQHDLIVEAGGRMFVGNDGGFYSTVNAGLTFTHSTTLPVSQFYDLCIDTLDPLRRFGGTQDTGTLRTTTGGLSNWGTVLGGDGMECVVDPTDSNKVYASQQFGRIYRSTTGGTGFVPSSNGINPSDRANWKAPLVVDPVTPSTLYTATYRVYRSTDSAANWVSISGDLTAGPPPGPPLAPDWRDGNHHATDPIIGTITAVGVSPADTNVIWAGTDDGKVWVSSDGGNGWTDVSPPGGHWVTEVSPDPDDALTMWLSVTGYRLGVKSPFLMVTRDLGANWDDLSAGLPQVPVNSVVRDPDWAERVFAGTDLGVFMTETSGQTWFPLGTGMPFVVVQDLVLHDPSRTLFAGTYGRSAYSFDLTQLPPPDADADGVENALDCAPTDPGAFSPPGEVTTLSVDLSAGTTSVLTWTALDGTAGPGTVYDLARGDVADIRPSGGTGSSQTLACSVPSTSYSDAAVPAVGSGYYYLVRGRNVCGSGGWGTGSDSLDRTSAAVCP